MERILKPDGRWIVSDYFRIGEGGGKSGHGWEEFMQKLQRGGWKIVSQRDITQNVLPTLACVDMWGGRLGSPLFKFVLGKIRRKSPAIYYLIEDVAKGIEDYRSRKLNPTV